MESQPIECFLDTFGGGHEHSFEYFVQFHVSIYFVLLVFVFKLLMGHLPVEHYVLGSDLAAEIVCLLPLFLQHVLDFLLAGHFQLQLFLHFLQVLRLVGQFQRLGLQLRLQLLQLGAGDEALFTVNPRDFEGLDSPWSVYASPDHWRHSLHGPTPQGPVPGGCRLDRLFDQLGERHFVLRDLGRSRLPEKIVVIRVVGDVGSGTAVSAVCISIQVEGARRAKPSPILKSPILVHRGLQFVDFEVQLWNDLRDGLVRRLPPVAHQRFVEREVALVFEFHLRDPEELLHLGLNLEGETLLRH